MKKIILTLTIIIFLSFSTQAEAAWYDWFWDTKKEAPIEVKNPDESWQAEYVNRESEMTTDTKKPVSEMESLRAEVATLKLNLDNLYKAHGGLVNDHNAL